MNPLPLHFVIKTLSHARRHRTYMMNQLVHMEVKVGLGLKIFIVAMSRKLRGTTVVAIIAFSCSCNSSSSSGEKWNLLHQIRLFSVEKLQF